MIDGRQPPRSRTSSGNRRDDPRIDGTRGGACPPIRPDSTGPGPPGRPGRTGPVLARPSSSGTREAVGRGRGLEPETAIGSRSPSPRPFPTPLSSLTPGAKEGGTGRSSAILGRGSVSLAVLPGASVAAIEGHIMAPESLDIWRRLWYDLGRLIIGTCGDPPMPMAEGGRPREPFTRQECRHQAALMACSQTSLHPIIDDNLLGSKRPRQGGRHLPIRLPERRHDGPRCHRLRRGIGVRRGTRWPAGNRLTGRTGFSPMESVNG